jgi:arylformamidase
MLLDISIPIRDNMTTWPGDPPVSLTPVTSVDSGDPTSLCLLTMGTHTGTHVDAFSHVQAGNEALHEMVLDPFIGKALVVTIQNEAAITRDELKQLALHGLDWRDVPRVLFRTRNSLQDPPYFMRPFAQDFVTLSTDAAEFLADAGVRLVGVDGFSVDSFFAEGLPVHNILMNKKVYILEGLYLKDATDGWYELLCLPLKIQNGDGAPSRAVLRPWKEPVEEASVKTGLVV